MLGDDYIAEHCINEYEKQQKEEIFRIYITDSLYALMNHSAFQARYFEMIESMQSDDSAAPEQSADEIKKNMLAKLNEGRE